MFCVREMRAFEWREGICCWVVVVKRGTTNINRGWQSP